MNSRKNKHAELDEAIRGLQAEVKMLRHEAAKIKKTARLVTGELKRFLRALPREDQKIKTTWSNNLPPKGALRYEHIQNLIISLRKEGRTFREIVIEARRMVPANQRASLSKSSVHRFVVKAKRGGYKTFGIEGWE